MVVDGVGAIGLLRPALERDEREGDTVDVDVLRRQQPGLRVWRVAHPPETTADHLLAQELALERPDPEDVRHVGRVPAFSEHRDGDHTTDVLTWIAALPDGVDDLSQRPARLV